MSLLLTLNAFTMLIKRFISWVMLIKILKYKESKSAFSSVKKCFIQVECTFEPFPSYLMEKIKFVKGVPDWYV